MHTPQDRSHADLLLGILNLHNETNITQLNRKLDSLGLGVDDIKVGVGEVKADVAEIHQKVTQLLAALPKHMQELRAGLEGLVTDSVGAMLRQGLAEEMVPLREELAGLGAAMGEQVPWSYASTLYSCAH